MNEIEQADAPYPCYDPQKLCDLLGIKPSDRVLEVGAGHNPFSRADVVVDIDFFSGEHRDGNPMVIEGEKRSYIQADVTALPFQDKSFDWVICLHVLEHVPEPDKACQELMRIAKKGFLETPRKWTEYYAGHPTHRWLIDNVNGTLTFEPVTWTEPPFYNFALPSVWTSALLLESAECTHRHIPCVQLAWEHEFAYKINGSVFCFDNSAETEAKRHYFFAKNLIYWMAEPEKGLFHAKKAYQLSPQNNQFRLLYGLYLIMCSRYDEAKPLNLNDSLYIKGFFASMWIRLTYFFTKTFRKHLNVLIT